MRRSRKIKLAVLLCLLAVAAAAVMAVVFSRRSPAVSPGTPGTPGTPRGEEPAAEKPVAALMDFGASGPVAPIIEALEHIVRKGRVRAALWPRKAPLCLCVLVDGAERYYELDRDMNADQFAGLAENGFKPLPGTMTRTTSIYRAVARRAVPGYSEDRGDRILVLLCPQADWPKLSLRWPPLSASPK